MEKLLSPYRRARWSLLAIVFGLVMNARAGDSVREVQEELRKRHLFYGDIDGKPSPEIAAAVQRYQHRKGFDATGRLTEETLQSLNLESPRIELNDWPDIPVLKSDSARVISPANEKLLETDSPALADATPAELLPPAEGPAMTVESLPIAAALPVLHISPPAPGLDVEAMHGFIRKYLDASQTDLDAEMKFYADEVDYFSDGVVSSEFIRKDVGYYYRRWPWRKYTVLEVLTEPVLADGVVKTRVRLGFEVNNAGHRVVGETETVFAVKKFGDEWKIVGLREKRLRK